MSSTYVIGDTARTIRDTLLDGAGAAIPLTGASVVLRWRNTDNGTTTQAAAQIISPSGGVVEYTFPAGAFPKPGAYEVEWLVTFSGGTKITVPSAAPRELLVRAPI